MNVSSICKRHLFCHVSKQKNNNKKQTNKQTSKNKKTTKQTKNIHIYLFTPVKLKTCGNTFQIY